MWVAEVSKNSIVLKMWFSTSVDITWYTEAVIYAKNLFLVRFSEWHRGSGTLKLTKCDKVEWGESGIMHVTDFFEWPHVWFVILLSYYWEWLMGNFAIILISAF